MTKKFGHTFTKSFFINGCESCDHKGDCAYYDFELRQFFRRLSHLQKEELKKPERVSFT